MNYQNFIKNTPSHVNSNTVNHHAVYQAKALEYGRNKSRTLVQMAERE